MSAAIEIADLRKTYRQGKRDLIRAVDGLSLHVPAGQVLGLLGANGAGKTTTIKMMCGLISPDAGTIRLNGHDIRRARSKAMRQIGTVLEGTRNIYWRLSAWQNLIYFGRLKGVAGDRLHERARQLLTELDLWARRDQPVGGFSRGMQQKVAIACALVADPPIVLLDEPTLGLDVQASRTVKRWVRQLADQQGKTVVLTTHQLDMAEELCDRVAIMQAGRLVANESTGILLQLFQGEHYQFRLGNAVDTQQLLGRVARLENFHTFYENGHTILSGPIADQDELVEIVQAVHGMGFHLLAVEKAEPTLEEVFVRIMGHSESGSEGGRR